VSDPSLKLPATRFTAVLDLGDPRTVLSPYPADLPRPEVDAEVLEDGTFALYLNFEDGKLHLEAGSGELTHHFHDAADVAGESSPWPGPRTNLLLDWASALAVHAASRLEQLLEDCDEAEAWHEAGVTVYSADVLEPTQLDVLEVELEGDVMMLPWLGSGHIDHSHEEGDTDPIALLWNPGGGDDHRIIARAWMDGENVKSSAEVGVDWAAVGLDESEVLTWLEALYINDNLVEGAAETVFRAAIARMAGTDR
jgi:hypothetical protein